MAIIESKKCKPLSHLAEKTKILELAGDPVRIRILRQLFNTDKICVTNLAMPMDMSVARVSHHLQLLSDGGLVTKRRLGKYICYSLVQHPLLMKLKSFICDKS